MRAISILAAALFAALAFSQLDGSYTLPLEDSAINYAKAPVSDRVAQLKKDLESARKKLAYDPDLGYLPSLLETLGVPASSQVLVFSKTSFQAPRISPRTPRAIYFNDSVTVGYVKGGDVLELTAQDARQGTIFYIVEQMVEHAKNLEFEQAAAIRDRLFRLREGVFGVSGDSSAVA